MIMTQQDDQLDQIASSMGTLKTMSRQIGQEVDEQAVWVLVCWWDTTAINNPALWLIFWIFINS